MGVIRVGVTASSRTAPCSAASRTAQRGDGPGGKASPPAPWRHRCPAAPARVLLSAAWGLDEHLVQAGRCDLDGLLDLVAVALAMSEED
jgi:hypothetical protein